MRASMIILLAVCVVGCAGKARILDTRVDAVTGADWAYEEPPPPNPCEGKTK